MISKNLKNMSAVFLLHQNRLFLILFIFLFSLVLIGFKVLGEPMEDLSQAEKSKLSASIILENDPMMKLLGKSFIEITGFLGEPGEKGYSELFGPHQYILYRDDKGFIQFSSPESLENETAISIILGPGREVLGATIGMHFSEIADVLGDPDFGPESGIDELYYMDYFFEKKDNQKITVFLSFAANSLDSPTEHAFIKQEYKAE